jgi:hypothetical protein
MICYDRIYICIRMEEISLNFGSHLPDEIQIVPHDDLFLPDNNQHYHDYRIGCDLCGMGDAYGFRIDLDIHKDKDILCLNDLNIVMREDMPDLMYLHECSNDEYIKEIYRLFVNRANSDYTQHSCTWLGDRYIKNSGGILSVFLKEKNSWAIPEEELMNHDLYEGVYSVKICTPCMNMLTELHPEWDFDEFKEANPISVYIKDVIDDIKCYFDFVDDETKELYKNFDPDFVSDDEED